MVPPDNHKSPGYKDGFLAAVISAAFLLLPLTHFKWLPNIGETRPISAVFFVIALFLVLFHYTMDGKLALKKVPGWHGVRFIGILLVMGLVSVAFVMFYGNRVQSIIRWLGYLIIFSILYVTLYAIDRYGASKVVTWIIWGYVPVIAYGIIEALTVTGGGSFHPLISMTRNLLVVRGYWINRVTLLANEASFLAFQVLLLVLFLPYIRKPVLKKWILLGIVIIVLFSKSVTVLLSVLIYFLGRVLFEPRMKRKFILLCGSLFIAFFLFQYVTQLGVMNSVHARMSSISSDVSFLVRFNYTLNLVYVIIETWGAGLGIGQYGMFWKSTYMNHINYQAFDKWGEVAGVLAGDNYMKPWSVILGIGVDLGVLGLLMIILFLWYAYKAAITPHRKAVMLASTVMLMGAYPIVTPHLWIAMAFILSTKELAIDNKRNLNLEGALKN